MLAPFECLCGNFILPEPASYVFFYAFSNLRNLLYIIKYKLTCPIRKLNPYRRLQRSIRMGSAAENLVNREFESHGPRSILLTDITYIPLCGRFCCLSTILDACTKQVLAYAMSESLEVDFVLETVQLLVKHHGISLSKETVIHSDQGTHYTSLKFIQLVENSALRRSMSRRGNCWDNAPQESFFGHMKDELASEIPGWTSFEAAKASIDRWMDYYNNDRCQWDLAKLSPNEYYNYITTGEYPAGTMRRRREELSKLFKRLYEDNVLGRVTDEQYRMLAGDYTVEQKALEEQIPEKEARLEKLKAASANVNTFVEKAKQHTAIDELTPELLRLFIQRIEVGERTEKYSRSSHQSIRIVYRDIGTVDSAMEQGEAQPRIAPPLSEVFQLPA